MPCGCPYTEIEAGGARAGVTETAAAGLEKRSDAEGRVWAWNPEMDQWQLLHEIAWGDTLWNLSRTYYGQPSLEGVRAIHEVPQNYAIQGPSPDHGLIPGDVILIPDLQQPFEELAATFDPAPTAEPAPTGDAPAAPLPVALPPPPSVEDLPDGAILVSDTGDPIRRGDDRGWWAESSTAKKAAVIAGAAALIGGGYYLVTR